MPLSYILDDYDLEGFLQVAAAYGSAGFGFVVTPNVDHLIRYHDDPGFRALYAEAAFILLDSRFLSHLFRLTKRLRIRVCTGSDLTAQLLARVISPDDRVVLIGASSGQAAELARQYGLKSLRHFNPPMGFIGSPSEVEKCIQFIESSSPFRYCFLAVGSPQQERLASLLKARNRARGLALCIGASVNFLTGVEKRAPRWMQQLGLEWLYRLAQDPGRLAQRYLIRGPRVFSLQRSISVEVRSRSMPAAPIKSLM
jgi:exopolysaccharide biosynthesis WecB/TagA/CpsF family protein